MTTRAFQLLEAFSADRRELTLTELARRADLPLSTAHRLVSDLTRWGALERDPTGRYRIGLRLWEVAALAPRGLALREQAMPFLEDLSQVTQENVQLAVREGLEVVYVERIAGRRAVPVLTRVGGRFPMHPTGVGLVLLAHAPAEVQEQVLAAPLARFTPHTLVQPAELRRALSEVRRVGFAVSDRQVTMDSVSVAAPVRGAEGEVVAALSIVIRADGVPPSSLVPAVQAAARGISRAVGAPDLRPPHRSG
ncbi:MAG TPA: IclR family transcriptional regulator [Mycobacteriales bacterium]|nr:IclR family transcriptional regulator [Mycobacteriales bacterium]